jgi:c-di-GMP-binding flagellar brake protein YcgR
MLQNPTLVTSSIIIIAIVIAFIFQFLQKQRNKTTENKISTDTFGHPEEIKTLLMMALRQKASLTIKINARGNAFISSIVEIPSFENPPTLLIDALSPKEGNEQIVKSEFISAEFSLKESINGYLIPYKFTSHLLQLENYQGYPALRISFPKTIKKIQRRMYLRVKPSIKEPIVITLSLGNQDAQEFVYDISGGGLSFYTDLNASVLWTGKLIDSVSFVLPDGTAITSKLTVSSFSEKTEVINGKHKHFFCSAEFVELTEKSRQNIIQYVMKREREELKKAQLKI